MRRLALAIGLSLVAAAAGAQGWRHVRTVGMIDMVLIEQAHDRRQATYRDAVGKICSRKPDFCKVLFWSDPAMVPRAMPMTIAQARAMRADWIFNRRSGYRQMLWACDIVPDPDQCFKP